MKDQRRNHLYLPPLFPETKFLTEQVERGWGKKYNHVYSRHQSQFLRELNEPNFTTWGTPDTQHFTVCLSKQRPVYPGEGTATCTWAKAEARLTAGAGSALHHAPCFSPHILWVNSLCTENRVTAKKKAGQKLNMGTKTKQEKRMQQLRIKWRTQ